MEKRYPLLGIYVLLLLMVMVFVAVLSTTKQAELDVNAQTQEQKLSENYIGSAEEINHIVTDDYKLVINYFDAYIWIVSFDSKGCVEDMTYIYKFADNYEAQDMVSVRAGELAENETINVKKSYVIDSYVVVEVHDSSFESISREMLEKNFDGLIVH